MFTIMKLSYFIFLLVFIPFHLCGEIHTDYGGKAVAKMNLNKFEEAIPFYDKAIVLAPDHPAYLTNRGLCYAYTGNLEKSITDFKAAIEAGKLATKGKIDERFAYTFYQFGRCL